MPQDRPATYRELFANKEYRAIFAANILSAAGDMLARVAVAIVVFQRTGSAFLSASSFAVSYLPSVIGGPVLATIADRLPWRTTLISSDLIRMTLIACLAIPGVPLPVLLAVLFLVALVSAPFDAARIAMMPSVLKGDTYVLGITASTLAFQASQVAGFIFGGAVVALISPRGALLIDAATFGLSALLIAAFVARRPAPTSEHQRSTLLADTAAGLRLIFTHPTLRYIVLLAWTASAFGFAHEGIAAPLATELGETEPAVGYLLAASPFGVIVGGIALTRLIGPERRLAMAPWLATIGCAALIVVAVAPGLTTILVCYFISGLGMAFILPLNAAFNRIVPVEFRARAAGVVVAGLMASQGLTLLAAGFVADYIAPTLTVAGAGLVGLICVLLLWFRHPKPVPAQPPAADYGLARGATAR